MDITRKELEDINNALMELEAPRMTPTQRDSLNTATNIIAAVTRRADNQLKASMMPKKKARNYIAEATTELGQAQSDLYSQQPTIERNKVLSQVSRALTLLALQKLEPTS